MTTVKAHVERCIDCYATPIDVDFKEPVLRESYEQMRADLMICVGIIMAREVAEEPQRPARP